MTSVRFTTSSGKAYLCGGTLLGARWVLTAGHCATDVNGSVLPAGAFALRVGSTRRDEDGTAVLVTEVIRHPNYDATNPGAPTNDLALLHLATPVAQQPLRLIAPGAPEAAGWGAGAQATIIGWGITKSDDRTKRRRCARRRWRWSATARVRAPGRRSARPRWCAPAAGAPTPAWATPAPPSWSPEAADSSSSAWRHWHVSLCRARRSRRLYAGRRADAERLDSQLHRAFALRAPPASHSAGAAPAD
jgi:hypothetical protein